MSKERLVRSMLIVEWAGFGLVFVVLWSNELLDLPHVLFGQPATPFNWAECLLETLMVGLVAGFVTVDILRLTQRLKYLQGFLPVCSFCKRIRHRGEWIPLERFVREHSEARMTHGLCPDCVRREYPSLPPDLAVPDVEGKGHDEGD